MPQLTGQLTVNGTENLQEQLEAAGYTGVTSPANLVLYPVSDANTFFVNFGFNTAPTGGDELLGLQIGATGVYKTFEYSRVQSHDEPLNMSQVWIHTASSFAIQFAVIGG